MATVLALSASARKWRYAGPAIIASFFFLIRLISLSWSLDNLGANVGLSQRSPHFHQEFESIRASYPDGTQLYNRRSKIVATTTESYRKGVEESNTAHPEVLFLVLSKDSRSWSTFNGSSPPRTVDDMLILLNSTGLDLTTVSFAVMTTAPSEFDDIISATEGWPLARVTVILREPDKELAALAGQDRHANSLQHVRRSALARLRNYLMTSALEAEKHIIWIDADVIQLSDGIVQTMITHSETNKTAGIMTTICHTCGTNPNYDLNAFRTNHSEWLEHAVPEEKLRGASSESFDARIKLDTLIKDTSDDEIISITSVGGTLLYVRASLVRYGLMFPWYNVVGTTWAGQGWMGLETEGLCWAAKHLEGGGCYVLGGSHHSVHACS